MVHAVMVINAVSIMVVQPTVVSNVVQVALAVNSNKLALALMVLNAVSVTPLMSTMVATSMSTCQLVNLHQ
jgi:hypothetical protein